MTDAINRGDNPFLGQATKYQAYEQSPRGQLRLNIIQHQLAPLIKQPGLSVLDVGCGTGTLAIWLAKQGHKVTAIDPASDMVAAGRQSATGIKLEWLVGTLEKLPEKLIGQAFDLVLCHSVIEFLSDPEKAVASLVRLTRPNGYISVETKNAAAGVLYNAFVTRDFAKALSEYNQPQQSSKLVNTAMQSFTLSKLEELLQGQGLSIEAMHAVRAFVDYLPEDVLQDSEKLKQLQELELAVSEQEPFTSMGRFLHVVAKNFGN